MKTYTIIKVRDGKETAYTGTAKELREAFKHAATYNPIGKYLFYIGNGDFLEDKGYKQRASEQYAAANELIEELAKWGYVVPKV